MTPTLNRSFANDDLGSPPNRPVCKFDMEHSWKHSSARGTKLELDYRVTKLVPLSGKCRAFFFFALGIN